MNSKFLGALAVLLMFLNTTHISAHHAFSAEFDQQKPIMAARRDGALNWGARPVLPPDAGQRAT
jgi:hypothetical protein